MKMDRKKELIDKSADIFLRYGIKSVSMDDIARELKVSKKTLYKFVEDKKDLVYQVMDDFSHENMCQVQEKVESSENAIDELLKITDLVRSTLANIHPSIHYDLEKYYPAAWEKFEEHKFVHVNKCMLDNITRGIEEEMYRKDVSPEIIAKLYVVRLDSFFDPSIFDPERHPPEEVHKEVMNYHIRGIASQKGIDYLKKLNFNYE